MVHSRTPCAYQTMADCDTLRPMLQMPSIYFVVAMIVIINYCIIMLVLFVFLTLCIPSSCMLPYAFASIMFMIACLLVRFVLLLFASCIRLHMIVVLVFFYLFMCIVRFILLLYLRYVCVDIPTTCFLSQPINAPSSPPSFFFLSLLQVTFSPP